MQVSDDKRQVLLTNCSKGSSATYRNACSAKRALLQQPRYVLGRTSMSSNASEAVSKQNGGRPKRALIPPLDTTLPVVIIPP